MKIDCNRNTITCDCGHSSSIQNAGLYQCPNTQTYYFECDHCQNELIIPIAFNDYLADEIKKHVFQSQNEQEAVSNNVADIFLGQNQIPVTDELIDQLVKDKGWNRDDLIQFKKDGAQYSVSRDSFIYPPEGDLDYFF